MWRSININKNLIKAETKKAVLISMPHNSKYDGYVFWHTSKLVRQGRHSAAVSISYMEDFTFTLKKYGKGKHNSRDVINEEVIGVKEFEKVFNVINENITSHTVENPFETHKPQELAATEVTADESLIDDE